MQTLISAIQIIKWTVKDHHMESPLPQQKDQMSYYYNKLNYGGSYKK